MHLKHTCVAAALMAGVASISAAQAALVSRLDGQAFYDPDRNLTWLGNANLAAFEKFGVPEEPAPDYRSGSDISGIRGYGSMNWYTAVEYINAMNANAYLGVTGWRLPRSVQPDNTCTELDGSPQSTNLSLGSVGYGCYLSELGHLLLELDGGASVIYDASTAPDPNDPRYQAPYKGFKWMRGDLYWTETDVIEENHTPAAYAYRPKSGTTSIYSWTGKQEDTHKLLGFAFVLPVMDGDINDVLGISTVPVPAAVWLFGSGLIGLAGVARRRRNKV